MTKTITSRQKAEEKPSNIKEESIVNSGLSGVAGDHLSENIPVFNKTNSEDIWSNKDSYIVLGRDRSSNDISGYGGVGHTSAYSIDLVVGRGSCDSEIREKLDKGETLNVDPDFSNDAARIYISQKADIDKYLNLNDFAQGKVGESKGQSAIGIKADSVRVVSREGIKLVTYADQVDSRGFDINERKGIDLISSVYTKEEQNTREDMQPIPKGENLSMALEDIVRKLDLLSGMFINFVEIQNKYNNMVATHTHISPFFGITVPPSIDLQPANIEQNISILSETVADTLEFKMGYLNKFKNDYLSSTSDLYINSRFHHLN